MDLREQQRKGWLYTCTVQQRLTVLGVIHNWADSIGQHWEPDPLESREMYRIFARELARTVQRDHDVDLNSDIHVARQWGRLGDATKAGWTRMAGGWLDRFSPGEEASRIIGECLAPPHFTSLHAWHQQHLLRQIAGEIETYLKNAPDWYGSDVQSHRSLASAIRATENHGSPSVSILLRWDHVADPQRGRLLGEIAGVARRGASNRRFPTGVRDQLEDLSRSADWVADLYRPRVLVRE